ncbi:MAG: carbohydrate ABC transporter permease [Oscillospiraceae bacterium]|nr:carbohydrate ABC transporter permease [Oscillospiraceae bacterium]
MSIAKVKRLLVWIPIFIFSLLWLVIAGAPFLFMALSTFKTQFEMLTGGVFALPQSFYLSNLVTVVTGGFWNYFLNSVIVVTISLFLLLMITSFAAYPLSRFKFKFRNTIFSTIVACMAIPIHVALIPIFVMMRNIGLFDSIWALIGPYIAFNLPISVFILTTFMGLIPREMEEAAEIDGCSKYRIFFTIMLPLSKPGLATLAIFNAINMWNEFVFAFVLTQSMGSRTLPLAIWEFQGQYTNHVPLMMTVLTLTAVPMIIAFIIGQDRLIKGMMVGAVKG